MDISYTDEKFFTAAQLEELFKSVSWLSGNYPERLLKALNNCETVFTAWSGDRLVGLINAIDDGELTAYVHYLCVNPEFQKSGIGKKLVEMVKEKYKDYLYIALVAENPPLVGYYEKCGFKKTENAFPMGLLNRGQ